MMNLKGHYKITCGDKTIIGENIITLLGELFFLNRAINNEFNPISYIVLGNSKIRAKKMDTSLGNETIRKRCVCEIDTETKQILLSCKCTAREILGCSEIGVTNGDKLISHDIFEEIDNEFIANSDSVNILYSFDLYTSATRGEWKQYTLLDTPSNSYNIYYTVEENTVVGVTEENTSSGYVNVSSLEGLTSKTGAYFHDPSSNTLYIRTTRNDNPNNINYKIVISTR